MIDIRKGKYAKSGLDDMCKYLKGHIDMNKMVEIGCFVGNSTSIFVQYFSKIFCVDPWVAGWDSNDGSSFYNMAEVQRQFDTQVYVPNEDIITKHKMTSKEANSLFEDESLDFVYIDGNHQYESVKEDLKLWWPKVKEGGFIGGHDYNNPPHPGVEKAVNEFFQRQPDKTFKDTSWLVQVLRRN